MNLPFLKKLLCTLIVVIILPVACDEDDAPDTSARKYSSEVVERWLEVQTSMLYVATGNPFGFNPSRYMAYCGVALYEAILPGMPSYRTLSGQLTEMPAMPNPESGVEYYWPAAAHAALGTMTQKFFSPVTAAYNEQAVTALRDGLNTQYRSEVGDAVFERSVAFGEEVANLIFDWAKSDNAAWPTSYTVPTGNGIWKSETGAAPVNPYWGYNRLIVTGSLDNAISPPLGYSTDASSPYYVNMNEVYTVSKSLTHEQKLIAKYFNDSNPGYPAGAHYLVTLKDVINQFDPDLEKAAYTYAKLGITMLDASTGSFKAKYTHWAERPFSYIRTVIDPTANPAWKPFLATPGFPDFPSNHAIFSSSLAYVLAGIYGSNVPFTDTAYDGVTADIGNGPENLGSRHYESFDAMMEEISMSRLYGGIHYRYSCEEGKKQGKKTAQNIEAKVNFLK
ncbi:vanadium-dependent haloperoxidase [Chryseolinea sp. T2]|uniref:vanadium-dependent haloperoxidase n=1 Tax=Chryseolinea sp. T2 TaxID=3129255 RepID=UPI0030777EC1